MGLEAVSDVDTIRRVHQAVMPETDYPWTVCAHCEQVWPCDARIVLNHLDSCEAETATAEEDATERWIERHGVRGGDALLPESVQNVQILRALPPEAQTYIRSVLRKHEWAVAVGCTTDHAYGDEGWRPGGPGQPHEHRVR